MSNYERNTVKDVRVIGANGPWHTKSGGLLQVVFALPEAALAEFLDHGNAEFAKVEAETGVNIRGLRQYQVSGIAEGSVGAQEFHRARTELIQAIGGSATWRCEDLEGGVEEYTLDGRQVIVTPPGILHTYIALEDNTTLAVLANTLFISDNPGTFDTYPQAEFLTLQAEHTAAQ